MLKFFRATAICAMGFCVQASGIAVTLAGSNTFVDLAWNISGPASFGCTQILADATGDASRSTRIVIYGTVNCPGLGGGFPMTGVAYVDVDGTFNLAFNIGQAYVTCPRLRSASGSCTVLNVSGQNVGNVSVTLQ